ncbi:nucleoprotein TPR-like [Chironomus tepperi]|uniref:nucleoprotein TPR-like n=1 Tax=Chironomus tepperi TaxID=113505 RepID=UPI00391F4B3F
MASITSSETVPISGNNAPSAVNDPSPAFINQSQESPINYSATIADLKSQLNQVSTELAQSIQDRENLSTILDQRTTEIERLQHDSNQLSQQLQESTNAKCEAIRQLEAIRYRVTEAEFKEKRFIHERTLAQNRIEMLTTDLKKNIQELQRYRMESTARVKNLEGILNEKSSELEMSIRNEAQLKECNEMLTIKVEELSTEIVRINEDYSKESIDELNAQREETDVVSDLKESLKEATDGFDILASFLQQNIQMMSSLESLEAVLENAKMNFENPEQFCKDCENFENILENDQQLFEEFVAQAYAAIGKLESKNRRLRNELTVTNQKHEETRKILTENLLILEEEFKELKKEMDDDSCDGSSDNLDVTLTTLTASEDVDHENEFELSENEEPQSAGRKRQREDYGSPDEILRFIDEVMAEKRFKFDDEDIGSEIMGVEDFRNAIAMPLLAENLNSLEDIYDIFTFNADTNIENIDDHVENYEEISRVEEHFEEIFENNYN